MKLEVFDVEHGQCALLTTPMGGHILIDCGSNSTTGWTPSKELSDRGINIIDKLVITNCDADHASDLKNLRENFTIKCLQKNASINSQNLFQQKSLGGMSTGIEHLCEMLDTYTHPVQPNPAIDCVPLKTFSNKFGVDFDDENSLSLAVFFTIGGVTFCFNGDMTSPAWKLLMKKEGFVEYLQKVGIFMASHHGRQDGCCDDLYSIGGLNPLLTIISDGGIQHSTQDTVNWYRQRTQGCHLFGQDRKVLTTRNDGSIAFEADGAGGVNVEFF